jgi:cyclophilin family peptidyl-prolyl cis-trans isomerase
MMPESRPDVLPVCRLTYPSNLLMGFLTIFLVLTSVQDRAIAGMVRIGAATYPSLQAAYAVAGAGSILQVQDVASSEGLYLNRDIDITLSGGYDSTFTANYGGHTTISGPLIVGAGSIVLENLSIAGSNSQVSAPDVVGKVQADAQMAITAAGLAVGTVTWHSSAIIPVGTVISQGPSSGTHVDLGTVVNLIISSGQPPVVTMTTSMGTITITLFPDEAPVTVQNFLTYVRDGFYDGLVFHRVIKNFMIQGGWFDSNFKLKATRAPIHNEANNGLSNKRGTVAMARTDVVDSATSQFFINTVNNTFLDYKPSSFGYAVFGEVTGGMDVVDAISSVETFTYSGLNDLPMFWVIILSARSTP